MEISPEKRIAGVLVPLFALRGENDLGIGDVGALREFIDWIAAIGFKIVQLLPINETGADNSPYNAISALAIEPTTVQLGPNFPEDLTREDFDATTADVAGPASGGQLLQTKAPALTVDATGRSWATQPVEPIGCPPDAKRVDLGRLHRGGVKYRHVKKLKRRLLEKAFASFLARSSEERRSSFRTFCEEEAGWLHDYVFFRVLMEENDDSPAWNRWPAQHRSMERARLWLGGLPPVRQKAVIERQNFFSYVQWIAHQQWGALKSYREKRDVALMGDIPFGISYYSADVFARRDEFVLDWSGGAPPEPYFKDDQFTQKGGQNWGLPLYRWARMRGNNF